MRAFTSIAIGLLVAALPCYREASALSSLFNRKSLLQAVPTPRRTTTSSSSSSRMVSSSRRQPFSQRLDLVILPRGVRTVPSWASSSSLSATATTMRPDGSRRSVDRNGDGETVLLGKFQAAMTKAGMVAYVASMCVALPLTLLPLSLLRAARVISKRRCEILALSIGQFCARILLRLIPFCQLRVEGYHDDDPVPSIWVANHVSALDTFLLLAADIRLRGGNNKRPVKVIYWKGLDDNPVTHMFFHMAGFIAVDMEANGSGNPNEYDPKSFKCMLKQTKKAFEDGFDLLIMPEGQLNPSPEKGLLPVYSGAYGLARLSRRPIRFVGIHGTHKLWHADESVGMRVEGRTVKMKAYPPLRQFDSADDFVETFRTVLGQYGATGNDLPREELNHLLFRMNNKEK